MFALWFDHSANPKPTVLEYYPDQRKASAEILRWRNHMRAWSNGAITLAPDALSVEYMTADQEAPAAFRVRLYVTECPFEDYRGARIFVLSADDYRDGVCYRVADPAQPDLTAGGYARDLSGQSASRDLALERARGIVDGWRSV